MSDVRNSTVRPDGQHDEKGRTRLSDQLAAIANELIEAVSFAPPPENQAAPTSTYRKLLKKAMSLATSAKRELEKKDSEIARLKLLSITDEVTRLLNRRGFD